MSSDAESDLAGLEENVEDYQHEKLVDNLSKETPSTSSKILGGIGYALKKIWQLLKYIVLNLWRFIRKLSFDDMLLLIFAVITLYFVINVKKKKYNTDILNNFNLVKTHSQYIESLPKSEKKKKAKKLNKHEEECRRIFEKIFECKFSSIRPDFLKNPSTGKNLELDGYNENIVTPLGKGLAFEYDGKQHSEYNPHFHKDGVDEFRYQIAKDKLKDKLCKNKGIVLIRIPHFVDFHDLERHIRLKLSKQNITLRGYSYQPDFVYKV